jgi:hypothetical protein
MSKTINREWYEHPENPMFKSRIIADHVSVNDVRLTTMECTLWKPLVAEYDTHRVFTRNSASSRAIPWLRQKTAITERPFVPRFRLNKPGMVAGDFLSPDAQAFAQEKWLKLRSIVLEYYEMFTDPNGFNIHKQWPTRLIEPWLMTTILTTSTEWQNFFNLRCSEFAQDEIRFTAETMREVYNNSEPNLVEPGTWARPYMELSDDEYYFQLETLGKVYVPSPATLNMISAGRCATVSYDNLGDGIDMVKDYERSRKLLTAGHWSPFEHQAQALELRVRGVHSAEYRSGNFTGWLQFRKTFPNEAVYMPAK